MKLLEEKILKSGEIKEGNIVKVDSFLNHRLDVEFLDMMGKEIYEHFKEKGINKILTIEASGIALAVITAKYFGNIPVVFAKKAKSANIADEVYSSKIESFTYKKNYTVTVSKQFLDSRDHLLVLDDFLAEGNALRGLIDVAEQAGAEVCGLTVGIEKGFQKGGDQIRANGYDLLSLAIIDKITDGVITFR
ncbi:MAG: xanthine phosphoribosyltransferase [Tissierellia bacterium]|nr:xanthine phosphoribosyltransferase [Tissierellia bacterium]